MSSSSTAAASLAPVAAPQARPRAVAAWLFACCALVFAMIVVGGATRLTHSGLSITEWQPIVGAVPPLSDAAWEAAFAKYRATPEYRLVNHGMSVAEFKRIFWWEYAHRLLGRAIGLAFLLPLLWFAWRRAVPQGYGWKLAGIFVLGGLQGALGWYMVQSGLVDDPRVSQFRLTAHLTLAFAIFAAMQWIAMSLIWPPTPASASLRRLALAATVLVLLMVVTGGFVAGIRAGFAYNTFPLMNGHLLPPEATILTPLWKNFFYNMAMVQFDHRLAALALAVAVAALWWRVRRARDASARTRTGAHLLLAAVVLQAALGIATVLHAVPLVLGILHQAGAVLVLAAALNVLHAVRKGETGHVL